MCALTCEEAVTGCTPRRSALSRLECLRSKQAEAGTIALYPGSGSAVGVSVHDADEPEFMRAGEP
jgi:hypothetical protein